MSKDKHAVLLSPDSDDAVADLIVTQVPGDVTITRRWPQRYLRMVREPSGRCLSHLLQAADELDMVSIASIDGYSLTAAPRLAGAIGALHMARSRHMQGLGPVQFDAQGPLPEQIRQVCSPSFWVSSLSEAAAAQDLKVQIVKSLALAGITELSVPAAHQLHRFLATVRKAAYGDRMRVLTGSWAMAIGHIAMLAHHVYAMRQGLTEYQTLKIWEGPIGNQTLFDMSCAGEDVTIVPPFLSACENHLSFVPEQIDGSYLDHFSACERILVRRPPPHGRLLDPPSTFRPAIRKLLQNAGLPTDRPFVTVHIRENRRRHQRFSSARNADINLVRPALAALVANGYSIVRLGDASMTPLDGINGVFDYALSDSKTQELDIALAAQAHFHIGTSSGMSLVPMLFGIPTLFLNWYPIHLIPYGARNHVVLKGLKSTQTNGRLTGVSDYRELGLGTDLGILADRGIRVVDLEESHITAAVERFSNAVAAGLHLATLHGQPAVFAPADDGEFVELERSDLRIV